MLDKMFEQLKDFAEMKEYAEAQYKTILNQSKKISELEREVEHLKQLLSTGTPIISAPLSSDVMDEETIAKSELAKLRNASAVRELTMEEARKVDIYAKLLLQIKNGKKPAVPDSKNKSTGELLSLVDAESNVSNE